MQTSPDEEHLLPTHQGARVSFITCNKTEPVQYEKETRVCNYTVDAEEYQLFLSTHIAATKTNVNVQLQWSDWSFQKDTEHNGAVDEEPECAFYLKETSTASPLHFTMNDCRTAQQTVSNVGLWVGVERCIKLKQKSPIAGLAANRNLEHRM